MYVKNAWYVAAWSSDLEVAKPYAMQILGEPIVLYRPTSGGVVVLADRCVHRLAPLSLGRCEGDRIRCMYHGLLYAPDGTVVEIPGQDKIPSQARVRSYPVVEQASWIWVWMGDADRCDPALIPPALGPDHPDYIMGHGFLDYAAEARLINDNLLDFSHLSYVHTNSFQAGPEFAQSLPNLETLERGVRVTRWTVGNPAPVGREAEGPSDVYMTYDFLVPGILLMWSGSFPEGTAAALDFGVPDFTDATSGVTFTSQAVTPLTDESSRYFFCWGPHRNHGDEALRDQLMGIADMAFGEDRVMIEAQHKVIANIEQPAIMPTAHDKGVTIFNRLVERLVRTD